MQARTLPSPRARYQTRNHTFGLQWRLVTATQILADALALGLTFLVAYTIRFRLDLQIFQIGNDSTEFYTGIVLWSLPVWLAFFQAYRLYDRRHLFAGYEEYARVFGGCTAAVLSIIIIGFLNEAPSVARAWLLIVWCCSVALVCTERFMLRRVVRRLRGQGYLGMPTVIVGANEEGQAIAEQLVHNPNSGMWICGFASNAVPSEAESPSGLPVLARLDQLEALVDEWGALELVVATTALSRQELLDLYRRFVHDARVELRLSSGLYELFTTGIRVQSFGAVPLMTLERARITGMDAALKTTLDYLVAASALVALSPLLLIVALLVRLDSPGPILYRRRVLGRAGKQFDAFKFRTMIADRRIRSVPINFPDRRQKDKTTKDPRITRIGGFLRRSSLDELPQLFNVLRGEMSLVGPRMISPAESTLYGRWQFNLLTVKPGITGPWQVQGRCNLSYEDRVALSMYYIRNYSIWADLDILLRTVPVVLTGSGAY